MCGNCLKGDVQNAQSLRSTGDVFLRTAQWASFLPRHTASAPLAGKEKKNFTPAIYLLEGLLKKWLAGDAGPALRRGRAGPPLVAGAGRARAEALPI